MAFIYDLADTWNNGGTTFTAIKMNVTDTASASASLLMDLQVGGTSKFSVRKDGSVNAIAYYTATNSGITNGSNPAITANNTTPQYAFTNYSGFILGGSNTPISWSNTNSNALSATRDLFLYRDAANTLAQRNGTNAQTFNLYNTYTNATNYERGFMKWNSNILEIGTIASGTGSSRNMGFYISNVRYQIIGGNFNQFDKPIYMNAADIVTGGAGFKIGTAATQKIGIWNATPVVQPTTGISAGAFVANTSGISDDTATFDGYTIGQVVAALRQIGVLA